MGAIAALAVLAGGWRVWRSQRPAPSATGTVQPNGTTVVDSRGIHIVTPAGWVVVATTPTALAQASQSVTQSNPQLASAMGVLQSPELAGAMRFFAYGPPAADGSVSDADVLVTKSIYPLSAVASANSAELSKLGVMNLQESPAAIGSAAGEELTYQLPLALPQGDSVMLNIEQFYVSNSSELAIVTLESTSSSDSAFPGIVSSFRLT